MTRCSPKSYAVLSPVLLAVLLCVSGCRSYRVGSLMHPEVKSVAVGRIENDTDTPQIGPRLRQQLAEELMRDGSLTVTAQDGADAVLHGRIGSVRYSRVAAARKRADDARDTDRDAYQTTIFRVEVTGEFETVLPGREAPLTTSRTVTGRAEFPELPDVRQSRQAALERALNDMAEQAVVDLTEAW